MPSIYQLKFIETERLITCPVQFGDEVKLNQAIKCSLSSLQSWAKWAQDLSFTATCQFVQRSVFSWESGFISCFYMMLIRKEDNVIINSSGFNKRNKIIQGLYDIGYRCDERYRCQGYVFEYANALSYFASMHWQLDQWPL